MSRFNRRVALNWCRLQQSVRNGKKNEEDTERLLAFIVRPLFAQLIVAAAQLVPLVLR